MVGIKNVCVLGAGSWGTALANHLCRRGLNVKIWSPETDVLADIKSNNKNSKYFPGVELVTGLKPEGNLQKAVSDAEIIVVSVPSGAYREVAKQLKDFAPKNTLIVSTGKGLEEGELTCLTDVLMEELGSQAKIAALSGPSFAFEVLKGLPTAVVIASKSEVVAKEAAEIFHFDYFRVYTSTDVVGVEVGGAIKNVIALAAGMADGAGMGNNARAALITRGLAEIQRLVVAMGGSPLTVVGLSGLGDLLLTSMGDLSRNRRAGIALGQGQKLEEVLKNIGQVVEGVATAHKAKELAEKYKVNMPIVSAINGVLSNEMTVNTALSTLLSRAPAGE